MILTPVETAELPSRLAALARLLVPRPARVLSRIVGPVDPRRATGQAAERHRGEALALAASFGMGLLEGPPSVGFSWNGTALRTGTEAYVLLHEVAHFQLAAPERRRVVDFGLGPGPETGDRLAAEHAARLFGVAREREEAAASLLGILWEAALGHPALASFLDQNWLEGGARAAAHFSAVLDELREGGFVDAAGRPTRRVRTTPERRAA
jgi:hypothetical protein